jgi:hypothetical protein
VSFPFVQTIQLGGVKMPRSRSLSVDFSGSTFYHVTKQINIDGIARNGLDPRRGGSPTGMAAARPHQRFRQNSIDKIHLTASWATAMRYVKHSYLILNRNKITNPNQCPAILKIWLPNLEKQSLKEDPDDCGLAYFLTTPILPSCIQVAMAEPSNDESFQQGNDIKWIPLSRLKMLSGLLPSYPDAAPSQDAIVTGM